MLSQRPLSGFVRWLVVCAGCLGALLAIDAFAAFVFVLLAVMVSGGPPNPYTGIFLYVLLPGLVLVGLAAAWGAYEFWNASTPQARDRVAAVTR